MSEEPLYHLEWELAKKVMIVIADSDYWKSEVHSIENVLQQIVERETRNELL